MGPPEGATTFDLARVAAHQELSLPPSLISTWLALEVTTVSAVNLFTLGTIQRSIIMMSLMLSPSLERSQPATAGRRRNHSLPGAR